MFSNVIVGIDGGPGGRDALALARHLAGHAEITLAHVYVESRLRLVLKAANSKRPSASAQPSCSRRRELPRGSMRRSTRPDLGRSAAGYTSSPNGSAPI